MLSTIRLLITAGTVVPMVISCVPVAAVGKEPEVISKLARHEKPAPPQSGDGLVNPLSFNPRKRRSALSPVFKMSRRGVASGNCPACALTGTATKYQG